MAVNQNNFLRFKGSSTPNPYTISADPCFPVNLYANEESCTATPLVDLSASNGIDPASFTIVNIVEYVGGPNVVLASPPVWNSSTQTLTTFRPINPLLASYIIQFTYADVLGNVVSDIVNQVVDISIIDVAWEVYPVSSVCLLDDLGQNTGYQAWSQLVQYNTGTGAYIVPLTLKANVSGDTDYAPPVQNLSLCPPPGAAAYNSLYISNFVTDVYGLGIKITSIYLYSSTILTGGVPTIMNIDISASPLLYGQTRRFNIPEGTWDTITINYIAITTTSYNFTTEPGAPLHFWTQNSAGVVTGFGSGGSGITSNPVTNTSPIMSSGFVIPSSSGGVTILAQ